MVVAFCTVATITSWKPNLRNACSACCANCGSDFENASSSISCAKTGLLSALSGLARLKLSAPARQNAISFSCSPPELSPALLCVRISSSVLTSHSAQSKVNRLRTSSASRVHALSSGAVDASRLRSRRMSAYWSRIACLSPSPTSAMRREMDRTISVSSATAGQLPRGGAQRQPGAAVELHRAQTRC